MKNCFLLLSVGLLIFGFGCGEDVTLPDFCKDRAEDFDQYIAANYPGDTVLTDGELRYIIVDPGAPELPTRTSTVTVNYKGMLTNGNVFDERDNQTFPLANLIPGWTVGIPKIGAGGSVLLFIPPSLGYGARQQGQICANSDLVFEIDLLEWTDN